MSYQRESVEFLPVTVTVDGTPVTTGIEFCVTDRNARPVTWVAPYVLGDESGILISDYEVGTYIVWARVTDSPEVVVLVCGQFSVS